MHEDFVDGEGNPQELHGVKKYWWVENEGDQDYFFDVAPASEEMPLPLLPDAIETELDGSNDGGQNKLLVALTGVVDIDDDNEPAHKNIPIANEVNPSILEQAWGHDGICFRHLLNVTNQKARLHFPIDPTENDINLQLFEGYPSRNKQEIEGTTFIWGTDTVDWDLGASFNSRWVGLTFILVVERRGHV